MSSVAYPLPQGHPGSAPSGPWVSAEGTPTWDPGMLGKPPRPRVAAPLPGVHLSRPGPAADPAASGLAAADPAASELTAAGLASGSAVGGASAPALHALVAAACAVLALAAVLLAACGGGRAPEAPGVAWHRFPVGAATRVEPVLAVIYSSDNIGPATTLAHLGYPDRLIFRLHQDHPQIKMVLTSCPASRYSGGKTLADSPEATATWRALAVDPGFDWIDLAGLGYSHSPPDDRNLNHHEFSVRQSGCNLDHRSLGEAEYCRRQMGLAREAYRRAGVPDDGVVMMRFPGMEHSPAALEAAQEAGFMAILDAGPEDEPGREWWTPLPGGGEILRIRNTNVLREFAVVPEMEEGLASGRIAPAGITAAPGFEAAVRRGMKMVGRIESSGGLLHLMDQWAETFREIGGVRPRYLIVDAVLDGIEARYGPRAWYPTSRDLVLWLDTLRHAKLSRTDGGGSIVVDVSPPESWETLTRVQSQPGTASAADLRRLPGLDNVSLRVELPHPDARLDDVAIQEGEAGWRGLAASSWWKAGGEAVVLFPLRGHVRLKLRFTPP